MISTSCRFCEFKIKEKGKQTGCELNLINRYKDKNINVSMKDFDDERGKDSAFEVDTFCLFRRPPGWKKAVKSENKTFEEIAKSEFKFDVTLLVFIPPESNINEVVSFASHVENMTYKPTKILFINAAKISPILFYRLNERTKIPWNMEFLLLPYKDIDELRSKGNDLCSKKVETTFIVTMDLSAEIKLDYLEKINDSIINELDKFVCITNDIGKVNFYQTIVYRFVRGNEQESVNNKIKWLTESQECPHLVKNYQE
jgi:hypothetical protein